MSYLQSEHVRFTKISRVTPLDLSVFTCVNIHILLGLSKGLKYLAFQSKSSFLCSCKITNIKSIDYIFLNIYEINSITNVAIYVKFNKKLFIASIISQNPNWGCTLI